MSFISFPFRVAGVLTDADSVKFSSDDNTYGLRRTDTNEILVANDTPFEHDGVGLYSYEVADPAPNLEYEYWIEAIYGPSTYIVHKTAQSSGISVVSLTNYPFTSKAEIEHLYSQIGESLRVDDYTTTAEQDDLITEIVNWATETVEAYTLRFYRTSDIVNSPWIRRRATIIAAHYLSGRRANGTQFNQWYQQTMEDLEKFLTPNPPLLPGMPIRTAPVPTISKPRVDDRLRYRKMRVSPEGTTFPRPGMEGYRQIVSGDYF